VNGKLSLLALASSLNQGCVTLSSLSVEEVVLGTNGLGGREDGAP
jgi:hypothetical protein